MQTSTYHNQRILKWLCHTCMYMNTYLTVCTQTCMKVLRIVTAAYFASKILFKSFVRISLNICFYWTAFQVSDFSFILILNSFKKHKFSTISQINLTLSFKLICRYIWTNYMLYRCSNLLNVVFNRKFLSKEIKSFEIDNVFRKLLSVFVKISISKNCAIFYESRRKKYGQRFFLSYFSFK